MLNKAYCLLSIVFPLLFMFDKEDNDQSQNDPEWSCLNLLSGNSLWKNQLLHMLMEALRGRWSRMGKVGVGGVESLTKKGP